MFDIDRLKERIDKLSEEVETFTTTRDKSHLELSLESSSNSSKQTYESKNLIKNSKLLGEKDNEDQQEKQNSISKLMVNEVEINSGSNSKFDEEYFDYSRRMSKRIVELRRKLHRSQKILEELESRRWWRRRKD